MPRRAALRVRRCGAQKAFPAGLHTEAAKTQVRRGGYPGLRKDRYDAIIDAIKTRLEV